jgi:hypothetical protein
MNWEKWSLIAQALPILAAVLIFFSTGGFTVGSQLAEIQSEFKLLRHEVTAQNALQDYRLGRLEKILIKSSEGQEAI